MRRLLLVVGALSCAAVLAAQQTPPPAQTPPAQNPPAQNPPQPQRQTPVFRTDIDVIRLDVSVLDKDRRPVAGLEASDFTVLEDGKPQRIVAVSEMIAAERDPTPTAWMRHVPPDTATNDLVDQVGDGRVFAIVMDDRNIPWDDLDIIQGARETGRYIIDNLGPSDIAAVVFPRDAGLTEDFTSDRSKLIDAINKFDPHEPDRYIPLRPAGTGGGGADMPYRFSPALMRTECERAQPTVPTLEVVAARMATVPNRRKTIILVSVGVPVSFTSNDPCQRNLSMQMKNVFRMAQQANINIYGVDPAGYRGYEEYLQKPIRRAGRPSMNPPLPQAAAEGRARFYHEFMEITADYTGARAVINSEPIEAGIDRIFEEDGFYYLVGYQTSNPKPDGKFRRVTVKVNRPGVTVRTRSGYFALQTGATETREEKEAPTTNDLGLTGMGAPAMLALRANVVPLGLASTGKGRDVDVAVILSVRLPSLRPPVAELLTLIRNVYDEKGNPGPPVRERIPLNLKSTAGDELRYEVFQRLTLAPGRYVIRLNGHSLALDRSASVYADLEVPDFTRAPLILSGVALGVKTDAASERTDVLAPLLPFAPTSAREFGSNETITVFLRVVQGGTSAPVAVTMKTLVLDIDDKAIHEATTTLSAEAFGENRSAPFQVELPQGKMLHGPHLMSITATLPGGTSIRRDVVFRIR